MKKQILILFILLFSSTAVFAEEEISETPKDTLPDKVSQINLIENDEEKVKAWAKISSSQNYLIVNKKKCSATVYDKDGFEINKFEVGVGREIGDDLNDTQGLSGKPINTTPAGAYALNKNVINTSAYGDYTLSLGLKASKSDKTKKVVALHKVPKFRQKERLKKFRDGNISNNRMSHGCINFLDDDFKEVTKYIKSGLTIYVLPEEEDNKLVVRMNDTGNYEMIQTKYPIINKK